MQVGKEQETDDKQVQLSQATNQVCFEEGQHEDPRISKFQQLTHIWTPAPAICRRPLTAPSRGSWIISQS